MPIKLPRGQLYIPVAPARAPKADPLTPSTRAWVQGVIDTSFAVVDGVTGRGEGKLYRSYQVGGEEEFAWSQGCAWTAQRMMEHAMLREGLREEDGEKPAKPSPPAKP